MADMIVEHAPAKVNLALHVTGRREDGYHLLDTLVVFTEAGDKVSVATAPTDSFSITGPFSAQLQHGVDDNLVVRARDLLRKADSDIPGVAISLEKNLPIASGIGGGSSDAAATLRALRRLWGLSITETELAELVLSLGADLPMCLKAKTLIARGIGEMLDESPVLPSLAMVLVNPGTAVRTPAVFRALESRQNSPLPDLPPRTDFTNLVEWLRIQTRNDLEAPAISVAPQITEALASLRARGAALARMSGSGATCFGLFASESEAARAASSIAAAQPSWYVSATRTMEKKRNHDAD